MRDIMNEIQKVLDKYAQYIGWGLAIIGIAVSIYGVINANNLSSKVLFVVITSSFAIVVLSNFITFFVINNCLRKAAEADHVVEKITIEKEQIVQAMHTKMLKKDGCIKDACICSKNINKRMNTFLTRLSDENEVLLNTIYLERDKSAMIDTSEGDKFEAMCKERLTTAHNTYSTNIYRHYNSFIRGVMDEVKRFTERQLQGKDYSLRVSVTLKLLREAINVDDDINKTVVFTAFRDKETYEEEKREIGKAEYRINKNIDFSTCISKERYICNNVTSETDNYMNEHSGFDTYYNCAVTVPIICDYKPSKKIYGFLCCDVLNRDYKNQEIFDVEIANQMYAAALAIGTFFDFIEKSWNETMDIYETKEFLTFIYNKLFCNERV